MMGPSGQLIVMVNPQCFPSERSMDASFTQRTEPGDGRAEAASGEPSAGEIPTPPRQTQPALHAPLAAAAVTGRQLGPSSQAAPFTEHLGPHG